MLDPLLPVGHDVGGPAASQGDATTFTYDDRGNRITEEPDDNITSSYDYDQANRLTAAGVDHLHRRQHGISATSAG